LFFVGSLATSNDLTLQSSCIIIASIFSLPLFIVGSLATSNELTLQPSCIIIASIFYTIGKHLVRFGCTDLGLHWKGLGGIEVALLALLFSNERRQSAKTGINQNMDQGFGPRT
jgi:hypothetical protein